MDQILCSVETVCETLKTFGVAVIPALVGRDDCDKLEALMDTCFESATANWDTPYYSADPTTWKQLFALTPTKGQLFQHYQVGQSEAAWFARTLPEMLRLGQVLHKTDSLVTSFDGLSYSQPPEVTGRGWHFGEIGYHTDKSFMPGHSAIQMSLTARDVRLGDATMAVFLRSHLLHKELGEGKMKRVEMKEKKVSKDDWYLLSADEIACFRDKCEEVAIVCPAGSVVLWDSRTIHSTRRPQRSRTVQNKRCVAFVCYQPRRELSQKQLKKRAELFCKRRMTSHWPDARKTFPAVPRTYGKPIDVCPTVLVTTDVILKLV